MTLTEIASQLQSLGVEPSKGLGQNFLHDQNLARWFAGRVEPEAGDCIVEIGPGLGSLTEHLVGRGSRVIAIERDARLAGFLRTKFNPSELEVIRADATRFDTRELFGRGRVRVIGNLPYSVSTPLIDRFASALSPACLLVLGLQRELAERLGAEPRTGEYGAMTVRMQRRWNIRIARRLPASVFLPRPRVESAILEMRLRPAGEIPACDPAVFEDLVRRGFSERRKQMRKLLGDDRDRWPEAAAVLGVPETARAEELSVEQWVELANVFRPLPPAQGMDESLPVVDARDQVIGSRSRHDVHVNNLRHRAVHILVFNSLNELFLQKRSPWKDRNPGLWDSSAAGHVDAGKEYEETAVRELREELGIEAPLEFLTKLPASPETGEEFISVYRARHDGPFRLAAAEIETGAFFPVDRVRQWAAAAPEDFTPVCRMCLAIL